MTAIKVADLLKKLNYNRKMITIQKRSEVVLELIFKTKPGIPFLKLK